MPEDKLKKAIAHLQAQQQAGQLPRSLTIFDYETTHLPTDRPHVEQYGAPRPVEIAAIRIDRGKAPKTFSTLINPGIPVSRGAQETHGIGADELKTAISRTQAAERMEKFSRGSTLVAHNAPFDIGVLGREYAHAGIRPARASVVDTLIASREAWPSLKRFRLGSLAEHFGFTTPTHRAMADVHSTTQLLSQLIQDVGNIDEIEKLHPRVVSSFGSEIKQGMRATLTKNARSLFSTIAKRPILSSGIALGSLATIAFIGSRFSGKDDNYNTIEGLLHGGVAGYYRKLNTEFGSGYDPVKAMAKMLGMSFEQLLGQKAFRTSLTSGKVLRELGSGVAGKAYLMESSFNGQSFQYVRKSLRDFDETVEMLYKNSLKAGFQGSKSKVREAAIGLRDLRKEARAMSALHHTETVPSAYSVSDTDLFMEYMPGKPLVALGKSGTKLPSKIGKSTESTIREAAGLGLVNKDIHGNNILFDPATGRTSWIDWGATEEMGIPQNIMQRGFLFTQMKRVLDENIVKRLSKTSIPVINKASSVSDITPLQAVAGKTPLQPMPQGIMDRTPLQNNRFDAFPATGFAATKKATTGDFGSPWKGLWHSFSFKFLQKYMAKPFFGIDATLLNPIRAAKIARNSSLEEFARSITSSPVLITRTENAQKRLLSSHFQGASQQTLDILSTSGAASLMKNGKHVIVLNVPQVQKNFATMAVQKGMNQAQIQMAVQSDDFLKTVLYHEILEQQISRNFQVAQMRTKHFGAQVLIGEGGFIRNIENKQVEQLFRTVRKSSLTDVLRGGRGEITSFDIGYEAFAKEQPGRKLYKEVVKDFEPTQLSHAKEALTLSSVDLRDAQKEIWQSSIRGGRKHNKRGSRDFVKQLSRFGG